MIEGLLPVFSAAELRERAEERLIYYRDKYQAAYDKFKAATVAEDDEAEADARKLRERFKGYKACVEKLEVLLAHLDPNQKYALGEHDLTLLGYITPRYRMM